MTTASLAELKRALRNVPLGDLPDLCIRLARYKKENKELLSYLLFEADDEPGFQSTDSTHINTNAFRKVQRDSFVRPAGFVP